MTSPWALGQSDGVIKSRLVPPILRSFFSIRHDLPNIKHEMEDEIAAATPKMRLLGSPLVYATTTEKTDSGTDEQGQDRLQLVSTEEPMFLRHKESTTIELFYDLFFVAN